MLSADMAREEKGRHARGQRKRVSLAQTGPAWEKKEGSDRDAFKKGLRG